MLARDRETSVVSVVKIELTDDATILRDKDIPIVKPEVFVRPLGHPGATSWRDICIDVSP
jgi:hypothetical protein